MKMKWYIGTLVVILSVMGLVQQEQITLPNQEIVLQFKKEVVSKAEIQTAIALLKNELQHLGVSQIELYEGEDGTLKITYYSVTDASSIKTVLLNRIRSDLQSSDDDADPFAIPFQNHENTAYNIDVYDIENGTGEASDLNGVVVLEVEAKADRFSKPKIYTAFIEQLPSKNEEEVSKLNRVHSNVPILEKALHIIPEVRAGPMCV